MEQEYGQSLLPAGEKREGRQRGRGNDKRNSEKNLPDQQRFGIFFEWMGIHLHSKSDCKFLKSGKSVNDKSELADLKVVTTTTDSEP
jgi:hypothetical protein